MPRLVEFGDKLLALPDAPPMKKPGEHGPVFYPLPDGSVQQVTYAEASRLHYALGQTLAFMLRRRGHSTPQEAPIGGSSPPMILAEAA